MRSTPLPRRPAVRLSQIAFGGAPIGNLYDEVTDEAALATVNTCWDNGIRHFDTAPHYGLGLSERRLGAALQPRRRSDWTLSTKVGRLLRPDASGVLRRVFGFSRGDINRSLEESLVRLGLERVDIALVHDPDDHYEQASREAIPALCELRDQGVIGAVGVGMNQSAMLARFVEQTDVDVVMCAGRYSLLEQSALADLLPLAQQREVAVLAAGVFNSGLLARADVAADARYDYVPAPEAVLARARALAGVCRRHGTSLPVAAVHFALAHPAVVSVVLGMDGADQVVENVGLLEHAPAPALWAELVDRGLLDAAAPVPV